MSNDYYQRLGVDRSASADDVRKAYRKLARTYHPDHNQGSKQAEEKFKQLNEAFEVLSDPSKRRMYDQFGPDAARFNWDESKAAAYTQAANQSYAGAESRSSGFDFENLMREMFGRRGARGPVPGGDLTATIEVSLREAVLGGEQNISVGGRRLAVTIPRGVDNGSRVRLAGQGDPGENGGPAGDLYLDIKVAPHPTFTRQGDDLTADLPITVKEAVLGAEVQVPTFGGQGVVKVPPKTQSGTKLRLRGYGVPSLRGGKPGNLYFIVQIKMPTTFDEKSLEAVDTIEARYSGDLRSQLKL